MSEEFKAIETQEALDAVIKARLERNTRTVTEEVTKKYEGYISPDEAQKTAEQIEALTKENSELRAKNSAYEISSAKMKIAQEYGLPAELADRINGSDEAEMKADAEKLVSFIKPNHIPQPKNPESGEGMSGVEKAFYRKNPNLKGSN